MITVRRLRGLTEPEADIARLVSDGLSGAEIARRLGVSERVVKVWLQHMLVKLQQPSGQDHADLVHEPVRIAPEHATELTSLFAFVANAANLLERDGCDATALAQMLGETAQAGAELVRILAPVGGVPSIAAKPQQGFDEKHVSVQGGRRAGQSDASG